MATTLGKNVPKYCARHKSFHLKYVINFSRNVGETEQHLLCHLHFVGALCKLAGETDTCGMY
jgi:hypothetical protein